MKRLVALRFSALGDVAMTVPVIYAVARQHPEVEICMVTRPFFGRLFINPPENVRVIAFDVSKEYKGLRGILKMVGQLRELRPDYVADLHDVGRTWIMTRLLGLSGARTASVDKNRRSRRRVMHGGPAQRNYIDRYFDVFRNLGFDAEPDFTSVFGPELPATPIEIKHPAVGIAPFARYLTKTFPPDRMRRVAETLASRGINVYLFGGRGYEAETLAHWQGKQITSVAGRYGIEEELALMARLDTMISMDSANQHLASLTGTRVVSVWGGTTPACGFMAYGQKASDAVCLNLPCQPCSVAGSPTCPLGTLACMDDLPPENIIDKIVL